jgi:hypothetical protein
MQTLSILAALLILVPPAAARQDKPVPKKRPLLPAKESLDTPNWGVTSSLGAIPSEDFRDMLEGFHAAWKGKAGNAEGVRKLQLNLHYDRETFTALPNRAGGYALSGGEIHVLADPNIPSSIAMGGAQHYLACAYPKLLERKDLPAWLLGGLTLYLGCGRWADGKVAFDQLELPLNNQAILSFQALPKSSDWVAFEKSFLMSGRDYEIRRRVIDLQGWAVFYYAFNGPGADGGQGKHGALVPALLADLNAGKKADETLLNFAKAVAGSGYSALEKAVKDYFAKLKVEVKDRTESDWIIGETGHYQIQVQKGAFNRKTKQTDQMILQDLKWKMELLFDKYALAFRYQGLMPMKAKLKLYKNRTAYIGAGAPPGSAAYYSPSTKELVGYEDSEETGIVFNILCHEGCHQFFDLAFPGFYESDSIPMWFSEGLADCFGASEIRGRDLFVFTLGGVAAWRVEPVQQFVQQNRHTPIKELLGMDRQPFMINADLHYPQSWSFVHFLWNFPGLDAGKGQYSEIVIRLIDGFKSGKSRDEVYKDAFQIKGKPVSIEDLEREWKAYVKKLKVRK